MKLRFDLLEQLTDQDILDEVVANNHRYSAEPAFAKTGVGYLKALSVAERCEEGKSIAAFVDRLKDRVALKEHLFNRAAQRHLERLGQETLPGWLPVVLLAQWAVANRPNECTYQHPSEAEITLADWNRKPQMAMKSVEENIRLDDFAEMSQDEAAVSLMLMFTAC